MTLPRPPTSPTTSRVGHHPPARCHRCRRHRRARDECVDALGGIDIVGNIAGIARHHHIAEVSEADWDVMNSINLKGPFFVAQATMPHLLERNGALINIASNAGLMGQAYTVPYCATKGGVVNLTRALAMEFVKTGVRINAIAPAESTRPWCTTSSWPTTSTSR